jgi:hypothetical protein
MTQESDIQKAFMRRFRQNERLQDKLLSKIKAQLPELRRLLAEVSSHWGYEDPVYRFYHQSFKIYYVQQTTLQIVKALKSIAPRRKAFCDEFEEIIRCGAGSKTWTVEHNQNWSTHTRVFLEAFFHAKYFLEMAVKYGIELKSAPDQLPSGWAALLTLYGIR